MPSSSLHYPFTLLPPEWRIPLASLLGSSANLFSSVASEISSLLCFLAILNTHHFTRRTSEMSKKLPLLSSRYPRIALSVRWSVCYPQLTRIHTVHTPSMQCNVGAGADPVKRPVGRAPARGRRLLVLYVWSNTCISTCIVCVFLLACLLAHQVWIVMSGQ